MSEKKPKALTQKDGVVTLACSKPTKTFRRAGVEFPHEGADVDLSKLDDAQLGGVNAAIDDGILVRVATKAKAKE